jgi:hypothetical protein
VEPLASNERVKAPDPQLDEKLANGARLGSLFAGWARHDAPGCSW